MAHGAEDEASKIYTTMSNNDNMQPRYYTTQIE